MTARVVMEATSLRSKDSGVAGQVTCLMYQNSQDALIHPKANPMSGTRADYLSPLTMADAMVDLSACIHVGAAVSR